MELTHASFFSGVGGLDLGLERAGWRTVSFSEIDPYASAVLAERWPGVPNLGDIVGLQDREHRGGGRLLSAREPSVHSRRSGGASRDDWKRATLWSGGFPCTDLSVAGKRAGLRHSDGSLTRSGLAHSFLDLVEQHRPSAILLENVPGLLSSHGGKDFGALLSRLAELGYWWAYRILDAQHFGVPQRRRRVFVVALHAGAGFGADSAAAVLSVGARCEGHSAAGDEAGEGVAEGADGSPDGPRIAGTVTGPSPNRGWPGNFEADWAYTATSKFGEWEGGHTVGNLSARDYKSSNHLIGYGDPHASEPISTRPGGRDTFVGLVSPPSDSGGMRAPDGLAGRIHYRKSARVSTPGSPETWVADDTVNTINGWDQGDVRTTEIVLAEPPTDDPLLPLGLDSNRYRCCGNGVVSNVSEWVGWRLREAVEGMRAAA